MLKQGISCHSSLTLIKNKKCFLHNRACQRLSLYTRCRNLRLLLSVFMIMVIMEPAIAEVDLFNLSAKTTNFTIEGGGLHQFSADIDNGGDFSAERFFVQADINHAFSKQFFSGLSIGAGQDNYDFSGTTSIGGLDPWSRVRNLRISAPLRYQPGGSWSYLLIPSLRYAYESDASISDSQTWGLLAGASYRVNESLSIGPGIGVFSQLEDDTSIFPFLMIKWQITPNLSLDTGRGFAATQGPGVQLNWRASEKWNLSTGGRYEKARFRLNNKGIGEDRSVPLFVAAEYQINSKAAVSGLLGADVGGNLRLEDKRGNRITRSDYDTAPILALVLKLRL